MTRTPGERITVRREGFCWPRRIAPASRTLPSSSSNICLFTFKLLFDHLGELRNLFQGQIRRSVLRIRVEQQDHAFSYRPIVNDAGATALSSRSNGNPSLAYSTTAPDESAEIRIRGDPGLKSTLFLVTQQGGDLSREGRSLNRLHLFALSANGG
jgi:hypothetical protein